MKAYFFGFGACGAMPGCPESEQFMTTPALTLLANNRSVSSPIILTQGESREYRES